MGCSQSKTAVSDVRPSSGVRKVKDKKNNNSKSVAPEPEAVKPKDTYAVYRSSHDAKLMLEKDCTMRGVTFLSNGALIAADYKNNKLKLFSDKFEFVHGLELESAPWDVCQATNCEDQLLATVPYMKQVYRIGLTKVKGQMRLDIICTFRTEGFCWGVTCFDTGVAVSVKVAIAEDTWPKPPEFQVHIHEFDGTFRRAIIYDPDGLSFFMEAKYLNVTYDDLFLLVSDYKASAVLCINNEDELIYTYKEMQNPNGIAMDEGKNLHITSFFGAQRVHKVGANGKYKDGLPLDEDRPLFPQSICYRKRDKIIVMTTDHSIEVYKLI